MRVKSLSTGSNASQLRRDTEILQNVYLSALFGLIGSRDERTVIFAIQIQSWNFKRGLGPTTVQKVEKI